MDQCCETHRKHASPSRFAVPGTLRTHIRSPFHAGLESGALLIIINAVHRIGRGWPAHRAAPADRAIAASSVGAIGNLPSPEMAGLGGELWLFHLPTASPSILAMPSIHGRREHDRRRVHRRRARSASRASSSARRRRQNVRRGRRVAGSEPGTRPPGTPRPPERGLVDHFELPKPVAHVRDEAITTSPEARARPCKPDAAPQLGLENAPSRRRKPSESADFIQVPISGPAPRPARRCHPIRRFLPVSPSQNSSGAICFSPGTARPGCRVKVQSPREILRGPQKRVLTLEIRGQIWLTVYPPAFAEPPGNDSALRSWPSRPAPDRDVNRRTGRCRNTETGTIGTTFWPSPCHHMGGDLVGTASCQRLNADRRAHGSKTGILSRSRLKTAAAVNRANA